MLNCYEKNVKIVHTFECIIDVGPDTDLRNAWPFCLKFVVRAGNAWGVSESRESEVAAALLRSSLVPPFNLFLCALKMSTISGLKLFSNGRCCCDGPLFFI